MKTCLICDGPVPPLRTKYCSEVCAIKAIRRRNKASYVPKEGLVIVPRRPTARDISRSPGCIAVLGEPLA